MSDSQQQTHRRIHGEPGQLATDLNLCIVPRWTIVPHLRNQNVAEHCWAACRIAMEICRRLEWSHADTNVVVSQCLLHDLDEAILGDTPSSAKVEDPITTVSDVIVKLADWIEARHFIRLWGIGPKCEQVDEYLYNKINALLISRGDHSLSAICSIISRELGI